LGHKLDVVRDGTRKKAREVRRRKERTVLSPRKGRRRKVSSGDLFGGCFQLPVQLTRVSISVHLELSFLTSRFPGDVCKKSLEDGGL